MHEVARNLRTAERFLLAPPLPALFGSVAVTVSDLSLKGARFHHRRSLSLGAKEMLLLGVEAADAQLAIEAVIVWTQADSSAPGAFVSGVRTYADPARVQALIDTLQQAGRCHRIEELRSTERFTIAPPLAGTFASLPVLVDTLAARGARVSLAAELPAGSEGALGFRLGEKGLEVSVGARVVWTRVKSMSGGEHVFQSGLAVGERPELMRLAIGSLTDAGRASIDTRSLALKLKVLRARARQLASVSPHLEGHGLAAEQVLLVQGAREELRLNPEEAMHWYRLARILIADPNTRRIARPIASHPDALAVWEYLERSVDPSIVGRAFDLHGG